MRALKFGGISAVLGILVWSLEWRLKFHALRPLVVLAEVFGLIALVFCIRNVASSLYHAWRATLVLWLILSSSSIVALFAVIPFRFWMPQWANDGVRRWYYVGMPNPENTYFLWITSWHDFEPHRFEAGILLLFFAWLLAPCAIFRIHLWSASLIGILGYALLAIAPVRLGLLDFDYDTFHRGIALDSIALSLLSPGPRYPDAHCIFLLGFLVIIFASIRAFLALPVAARRA